MRSWSIVLCLLLAAGCSSGFGSSSNGSLPSTSVNGGTSGATGAARTVTSKFTIAIPRNVAAAASARRAQFVGASTNGAVIVVKDHNTQAAVLTFTADLSPSSNSCGTIDPQGDRSCTVSIALAPTAANDSDDFAITTYDQAPVAGSIPGSAQQLATGVVLAKVIAATAVNTIAITLDGIPASVVASTPRIVFPGAAGARSRTFIFSVLDAAGETIVGAFTNPVTLTVNDPAGATTIGVGGASGPSATLASSSDGDDVVIAYNGSGGSSYSASIGWSGTGLAGSSVAVVLFTVSGPAAYNSAKQTVTFTSAGAKVALTLNEPGFTGNFTESDTCTGIATVAIGATSGNSATATVTGGTSGTCAVSFGDGNFSYPAISLNNPGSTTDSTLTTIVNDTAKVSNQYNTPGGAVDVYANGKTYTYYFGFADRSTGLKVSSQTGFELGSVTKSFTALALTLGVDFPSLIKSVNPGTTVSSVRLADPVATYIPLYPAAPAETTTATGAPCPAVAVPTPVPASAYSASYQAMTLQDLGDHTSTLPDQPPNVFGAGTLPVVDRPCYPSQILLNYAATYNSPAGTTIGTSYNYSDIGFGLLGDALQGIYDAPYYTLTKSLILTPLSMTSTYDVQYGPQRHTARTTQRRT